MSIDDKTPKRTLPELLAESKQLSEQADAIRRKMDQLNQEIVERLADIESEKTSLNRRNVNG